VLDRNEEVMTFDRVKTRAGLRSLIGATTLGACCDLLLCVRDLHERPSKRGDHPRFGPPGIPRAMIFQTPSHKPSGPGRPTLKSTARLLRVMHAGLDQKLRALHGEQASARRTTKTLAAFLWLQGCEGLLGATTVEELVKRLKKVAAEKPARRL
jgi:hypothetical protein